METERDQRVLFFAGWESLPFLRSSEWMRMSSDRFSKFGVRPSAGAAAAAALVGFSIGYWRGRQTSDEMGLIFGACFAAWLVFPYLMALGPRMDLVDVRDNKASHVAVARVVQVLWIGLGLVALLAFMLTIEP